jgi:hypothetical protein
MATFLRPFATLATLVALAPRTGAQSVCTLATLQEINDILPICCGSTAAPDCSAGMPPRCTPECAELLVPFWEQCSTLMQFMGPAGLGFDVHAVADFMRAIHGARPRSRVVRRRLRRHGTRRRGRFALVGRRRAERLLHPERHQRVPGRRRGPLDV